MDGGPSLRGLTHYPSTVVGSLPPLFSPPTDLPPTHVPHTTIETVVWGQGWSVRSLSVGSGGRVQNQEEWSFKTTYWEGSKPSPCQLNSLQRQGTDGQFAVCSTEVEGACI